MALVTDHTNGLYKHVNELEEMGNISENQARRLKDRINALEGDIKDAYVKGR